METNHAKNNTNLSFQTNKSTNLNWLGCFETLWPFKRPVQLADAIGGDQSCCEQYEQEFPNSLNPGVQLREHCDPPKMLSVHGILPLVNAGADVH